MDTAAPGLTGLQVEASRTSSEFHERLEGIRSSARSLPPGADEETQDELGLVLQLLPAVERLGNLALLDNLELAVESLISKPPNRLLAIRLREASQQSVLRRSFYRSILPGTSASTWVVAGMASLVCFAIPALLVIAGVAYLVGINLHQRILLGAGRDFGTNQVYLWAFILVALMGALGSIVSILVRIKDFSEIRVLNPPALFWTGFFKPVIGASFALFVSCALAAGLISVASGINTQFMLFALGFIAGFSERFAPDLVSRLERSVAHPEPHKGATGQHPPNA